MNIPYEKFRVYLDYKGRGMWDKYPVLRNGVEVWVPRDKLSVGERRGISAALRRAASEPFAEADQLGRETDELIAVGQLQPPPRRHLRIVK